MSYLTEDYEAPSDAADAPLDLSDKAAVRKRNKQLKYDATRFEGWVKDAMATPEGRHFFRVVMFDWCHTEGASFALNQATMSFMEGERNIGQKFKALIVAKCPQDYVKMLQENVDG